MAIGLMAGVVEGGSESAVIVAVVGTYIEAPRVGGWAFTASSCSECQQTDSAWCISHCEPTLSSENDESVHNHLPPLEEEPQLIDFSWPCPSRACSC